VTVTVVTPIADDFPHPAKDLLVPPAFAPLELERGGTLDTPAGEIGREIITLTLIRCRRNLDCGSLVDRSNNDDGEWILAAPKTRSLCS
jgi:hypothetical protein